MLGRKTRIPHLDKEFPNGFINISSINIQYLYFPVKPTNTTVFEQEPSSVLGVYWHDYVSWCFNLWFILCLQTDTHGQCGDKLKL